MGVNRSRQASSAEPEAELDRLADQVMLELVERIGVRDPERWVVPLRRRFGWGFEPETLAKAGDALGVTRERVRQVSLAVESLPPPTPKPIPLALIDAIELVDWDEPGDVSELLIDSMLAGPESHWSAEGLLKILGAYGRGDLSDALQSRIQEGKRRAVVGDELKRAVRQARHKSGFLDVRTVRLDGETVAPDTVLSAARQLYKRVTVVGPWLLCGSKKATTVENAAIVQLTVAGELTGDEVFEGIGRVMRKRRYPCPPQATTLAALEESHVIRQVRDGYVRAENAPEVEIVGNDLWLLELLSAEPYSALAVDDVLRRAKADKRSVSSINVHLSFTSFVRKDRGLVYLVGSRLDPDDADVLRRAARAMQIPSEISYAVRGDGVELVMTLGTNYLNSGIVTIDKGLRALIGDRRPNVACCDATHFDVRLGLDGGTWYGWSSLFNHLVSQHGVDEGDIACFLMTDDLVRCQEPWAVESPPKVHDPLTASGAHPHLEPPTTGEKLRVVNPTTSISPGDPWPDPRGSRTLVLSVRTQALTIPGSTSAGREPEDATLTQKYGAEAARIAREMLEIRPSGGRVWVDRDGHTTTLINGQLTYLGALSPDWSW